MHVIVALLIGLPVAFGAGWYCHYRYGSTLKAKVEQIATELSSFTGKGKASSK